MIEWIPVTERLPEEPKVAAEAFVVAWYPACQICHTEAGARLSTYYKAPDEWDYITNSHEFCSTCRPTHWAEINPPK